MRQRETKKEGYKKRFVIRSSKIISVYPSVFEHSDVTVCVQKPEYSVFSCYSVNRFLIMF